MRSAASRADRAPPSCARWPDERLDRMSRPGPIEARSAAPWMASTPCQNAGCPVCEADEKHRFSRAERLDRMSRPGLVEARSAAPWMGEGWSAQPIKSAAFESLNALPWMARPGPVEARSAAPWMASTPCQNAGCPVCEADEKHRFSRGEGKRLRSAASRADRAPPSCARWPDERLDRMSRPGPVEATSAAPWMGEGWSAQPIKSAAFESLNALPWMARPGPVEARSAAPWMGEGWSAQPIKSAAFESLNALPWMARPGPVEATSAAPWMA